MATFFLDDCINFVQLASGKWTGHTLFHTLVSVDTFEKGELPHRFKGEQATEATEAEASEYWAMLDSREKAPEIPEDYCC
jgi:hypothetical protein